jgi:hypothetical protein
MWQAVDLFSDWLVRIPRQARLVHVGKGSTRETAAASDKDIASRHPGERLNLHVNFSVFR